jgi:cytochrome P450 family 4
MLDTLLSAEANNNQIDEMGIREEVNTFTFEGFDTSSTAMTFILLLVATYPEVQQMVYDEIQQLLSMVTTIRVGSRFKSSLFSVSKEINVSDLAMQDYSTLDYMNRVIKECLRLYPPVSFISRSLSENLVVSEFFYTQLHIHIPLP